MALDLESLENDISYARSTDSIDSNAPLLGAEEISRVSRHEESASGSNWAAYLNITCVVAGTGILGLPYAIKQSGWVGLSLIVLSMVISLYTSIILIKCLYYNNKTRLRSYEDIGYHAYGNFGKYFLVGIFNNTILLGVPVLFLILAGQNLDAIFEHYWNVQLGVRVWICISSALVALPFIFTKTMKEMILLSFFGAFATFFCVIAIVVLSFEDLPEVYKSKNPPTHSLISLSEFPIALATISFSYGGNSVFPQIEESMDRRKDWNKVVAAAMATCAIMYTLVSFTGYFVYGDSSLSPIFNNLPQGPLLTIASLFVTVHVLFTAPILLISFAIETEKVLKITQEYHSETVELLLRAIFRTFLMVAVTATAVFVPFFGDLMSLLGALAMCLLVFILPVVFYIKLYGFERISYLELVWGAFVMLIGMIGCVIGTIDALRALIRDFHEL
ncbi:8613_t:CDS:2 [Acaulospora morrowiae]|uniref:8613_t:CDS:1 n=1 Tax=Acaulospora morrowiae TaxID=94023 RepID=A0A9N9HNP8_9GLOM|nr:8613_t:CDS:2 [Acaulospora morrowiae]